MWKSTRGITLPSFGGNAMEPRATIPREGRRRKKRGEIFSQSSYDIGWYELTERSPKKLGKSDEENAKAVCPADKL